MCLLRETGEEDGLLGQGVLKMCIETADAGLDLYLPFFIGSLSIVGVGFVKIPPQFYEKGPFYV